MLWNEKRVSIIVMTYRNVNMLRRSLHSVCSQDYPHLELIISDDGSADFDEAAVQELIDGIKGPNIERVRIVHSAQNTGTVQNLRRGLAEMTGDYYMNFGADDALYDSQTISAMMKLACLHEWEPLLVTGQMIMCDEKLEPMEDEKSREYLKPYDKEILKARDAKRLYATLVYRCMIATVATLYRKDFPEVVDAYNTAYRFYEDYPTFLRMARKGITPLFIDRPISLHAAGGIANGAANLNMNVVEGFHADRMRLYQQEVRPTLAEQPKTSKRRLRRRQSLLKKIYFRDKYQLLGGMSKLKWILRHPYQMFCLIEDRDGLFQKVKKAAVYFLLTLGAWRASYLFPDWLMAIGEVVFLAGAAAFFGILAVLTLFSLYAVYERIAEEANAEL